VITRLVNGSPAVRLGDEHPASFERTTSVRRAHETAGNSRARGRAPPDGFRTVRPQVITPARAAEPAEPAESRFSALLICD
jgi:hypothetical protein